MLCSSSNVCSYYKRRSLLVLFSCPICLVLIFTFLCYYNAHAQVYTGPCYRHGCSSDIKQCWEQTAEGLRVFLGDGDALHRELVNLNLVSKHASSAAPLKAKREVKAKAKRKITRTRVNANTSSYGTNAHLKGTGLEKVILEARAKAEREEQLR